MKRSVFTVIGGIIFSFLVFLMAFYVFVTTGLTPIGRDIQMVIEHQSFNNIEKELGMEGFLQLEEQSFQFTFFILFPLICFTTGLIVGFIGRKQFWLLGFLSVIPFTILFVIIEVDFLTIPLSISYLGLGSLGGFIAGYFKRKRMTA